MKSRSIGFLVACLTLLVMLLPAAEANKDGWLEKVPHSDHAQKSPIHKKAGAIIEGQKTFRVHCAQCHGENGRGSDRAPRLVSYRVQHRATEGDLHWLLVNGNKEQGMPSWAKLGDVPLWEVVSYLRSLR